MRRAIPLIVIAVALLLLPAFVAPAPAQFGPPPAPDIAGRWYMGGNLYQPCEIIQVGPDGRRAQFINEHGDRAWGTVYPDHVWVPTWTDGVTPGLMGRIRGDRIIWPNGTYWER
jgi:hypothetical protein